MILRICDYVDLIAYRHHRIDYYIAPVMEKTTLNSFSKTFNQSDLYSIATLYW